jgi:hypothetical protein
MIDVLCDVNSRRNRVTRKVTPIPELLVIHFVFSCFLMMQESAALSQVAYSGFVTAAKLVALHRSRNMRRAARPAAVQRGS